MPTPSEPTTPSRPWLKAAVLVAVWAGGCGRTQVEPQHRRLVLGLATATSARNDGWLAETAAEIEQARKAGTLSQSSHRALAEIVEAARAGDWDSARDRAYALRDAQRPTEEDLERLRRREMPEPRRPSTAGTPARR